MREGSAEGEVVRALGYALGDSPIPKDDGAVMKPLARNLGDAVNVPNVMPLRHRYHLECPLKIRLGILHLDDPQPRLVKRLLPQPSRYPRQTVQIPIPRRTLKHDILRVFFNPRERRIVVAPRGLDLKKGNDELEDVFGELVEVGGGRGFLGREDSQLVREGFHFGRERGEEINQRRVDPAVYHERRGV